MNKACHDIFKGPDVMGMSFESYLQSKFVQHPLYVEYSTLNDALSRQNSQDLFAQKNWISLRISLLGVINVVTAARENAAEVGKAMCKSPEVAAMSFTGSTRVGKILYEQCAGTVKKLSLELGGNAPFIVFDSADVDLAVAGCAASKFRNTGQACIASNRVLVQEGIHDRFVEKLKEHVETKLVLGNGFEDGVNQVIS